MTLRLLSAFAVKLSLELQSSLRKAQSQANRNCIGAHPTLSRWIEMIKHHVNNHAGYGDVQPERQRPPRDAAVPDEVSFRGAIESDQYHWNYDDGEDCMSREDSEIERADQPPTSKPRGAVIVMVGEIRNEKDC